MSRGIRRRAVVVRHDDTPLGRLPSAIVLRGLLDLGPSGTTGIRTTTRCRVPPRRSGLTDRRASPPLSDHASRSQATMRPRGCGPLREHSKRGAVRQDAMRRLSRDYDWPSWARRGANVRASAYLALFHRSRALAIGGSCRRAGRSLRRSVTADPARCFDERRTISTARPAHRRSPRSLRTAGFRG